VKLSRTLAVTCVLLAACGLFAFDLRRERSGEIITDSYRSEPLGKSIGYSIYVPHGARGGALAGLFTSFMALAAHHAIGSTKAIFQPSSTGV
jgi:hypothetical protein